MKKLIKSALALATLLFAASCQQENLEPVQSGSLVTFSVEVPGMAATKALGDEATLINDLVYAVYRTEADNLQAALDNWAGTKTAIVYKKNPSTTVFTDHFSTTVELELVNNQNYIVLFWAQNSDTWVSGEEFDLTNITYPESLTPETANSDEYAAFSGVAYLSKNETVKSHSIELTRPFAQINVATVDPVNYNVNVTGSTITIKNAGDAYNVAKQAAAGNAEVVYTWTGKASASSVVFNDATYEHYVAMNYVFANGNVTVAYNINTEEHGTVTNVGIPQVPVAQNFRTNIIGNLLTSQHEYSVTLDKDWGGDYWGPNADGDYNLNKNVSNANEFAAAFAEADVITLANDINLNDLIQTRSETTDPTYVLESGKTLTIDLNGKKLSATSTQTGKNYNMFDVRGTLTVKNGTMECEHLGENMGWNSSTNLFNVTAGGVLNLEGVTAKNLGGSDMAFVAHLNNWGDVTLMCDNCILESNYVPVRVFNSGPDINNVDIKNSTLKGGSYAFWVHNYTVEDFGSEAKVEAQKALLNFNIYGQGNTFTPDVNGIRYGFTNSVKTDAYGITKTVSEDGTEVTLGSLVENGLIRRGVAGAEENTTITKVIVEEGVSVLYDRTFRRFYALETVELPSTLTVIGEAGTGVFQSCNNLKNIVLPESLTVLGKGSFQECASLESINIPTGVTRIEENALRATGLVSVEFHEGVTYFGAQAFRDCKNLKEVYINAPEFTIEPNAFGSMAAPYPAATIYVANGAMVEYLKATLTYASQFKIVVPGLVNTTDELKAALADPTKNIITLAEGETFEGTFEIKRPITIVSENADNKSTIIGRVNVKGNGIESLTFNNVRFATNDESKVKWTTGGSDMKSKPSIVMAEANDAAITFNNCDFDITTSAFAYTNTTNTYTTFDNCTFNGAFNYAMYVRANIEVTNCTYNTTVTNVLVGACVNNLANGKVVFMNNDLPTGANIGLAGAVVFCSTNNDPDTKKWNGPVEFTVKNNKGFAYAYERMGDFVVDPADHIFTEGSETFSF